MSRIVLPGQPLSSGTTALRPWRDSDVPALVLACRDPEIVRWTRVPENYGESDARAFLLYRYDALLAGSTAPFAIVSGEGRLLGSVALMRLDWFHRRGEVGYWLAVQARGQGHATRAVEMICEWGVRTLGLERLELYAAVQNRASQRVAERAGFTREATLRAFFHAKDSQHDMVAFGLLAGELR
jgi:RimJ/RimL family protein N-acetyltransferase